VRAVGFVQFFHSGSTLFECVSNMSLSIVMSVVIDCTTERLGFPLLYHLAHTVSLQER